MFYNKPCWYNVHFSHVDRVDHFSICAEHPLPDPGKISQVEDVMELCRSRKHFDLGQLPESAGQ